MSDLEIKFQNILKESKNLDVPTLKKAVSELMNSGGFYSRQMIKNFAPHGMFRARLHNFKYGSRDVNGRINRFKYENEFWNPPSHLCLLGRCNDTNESILYCTNDADTAILEVKPKKGFISLSVFTPRREGGSRAMYIGEKSLSKVEAVKHLFKDSQKSPLLAELDEYLDKLFYSNVTNGDYHLYKVSTAITQNLMSKIVYDSGQQQTMQALVYSSVEKKHSTLNFVLRPNHAVHLYKLHIVQTLEILENTETTITVQLARIGYPMTTRNHPLDNPKIRWKNIRNGEVWDIAKPVGNL